MGQVKNNSLSGSSRNVSVEILRIIACLLVVGTHVRLDNFIDGVPSLQRTLLASLTSDGVAVFFMITGFFYFRDTPYKKRAKALLKRIVIPMVLVSLLAFYFYGHMVRMESLSVSMGRSYDDYMTVFAGLLRWTSVIEGVGHYWYLFAYIIIVLIYPALKGVRDAIGYSFEREKIAVLVIIILLAVNDLSQNGLLEASLHCVGAVVGAIPLILTGSIIFKNKDKLEGNVLYGLGGLLLFVVIVVMRAFLQMRKYEDVNWTETPLFWFTAFSMIATIGLAVFCLALTSKIKGRVVCAVIRNLGRMTFPIYLFHAIVNDILKSRKVDAYFMEKGDVFYQIFYALLVFGISLVVSEVIVLIKDLIFGKKKGKKALAAVIAFFMMTQALLVSPYLNNGENVLAGTSTPYQRYGTVKVVGNRLCGADGNPVQLRGMSTHGIQWDVGEWVFNDNVFDALAGDWKCDVIRLAMYVSEGGYASDPERCLSKVETGIELATARGMYVIVDWHILTPGNPTDQVYLNAGKDLPQYSSIRNEHPEYTGPQLFFAYLSQKYGDRGNVLFETANEPNCLNAGSIQDEWNNVLKPYHESVVSAIRTYDKDNVPNIIICGTGNWDQYVDQPASNPVTDPSGQGQIMYTIHFYAGTHDVGGDRWIENNILTTMNAGLAVFCTEWGVSRADGNGGVFTENAERWLQFFADNGISWCAWSLARKDESSAAFSTSANAYPSDTNGDGIPNWNEGELSEAGRFLRNKIREGKDDIDPSGGGNNGNNNGNNNGGNNVTPQKPRNVDREAVGGFVERLYTVVLGRPSEQAGKEAWTDVIASGSEDGGKAAKGFIFSDEYKNKWTSNDEFVRMLYKTFFDREPDQEGYNGWVSVLNNGGTREHVVDGFINSFEWAELCAGYGIISGGNPTSGTVGFVKRMYTTCLDRDYDVKGLRDWVFSLSTGRNTGADIAYGFFLSSEFTSSGIDDAEFVRRLYRTFFDREPDQGGYNAWLGVLSSGKSRKEVLDGFIYSNEFSELCSEFGIRRG